MRRPPRGFLLSREVPVLVATIAYQIRAGSTELRRRLSGVQMGDLRYRGMNAEARATPILL